jgi:hypothetical protein
MHRSSQSIAAIATALAKAQIALINPEKTMTATIRDDRRGPGRRTKLSLRAALNRPGTRPQGARSAGDCPGPDH